MVALAELVGDGLSLFVGVHPVDLIADLGGVERWLRRYTLPASSIGFMYSWIRVSSRQVADVAAVDIGISMGS